MQFVCKNCFYDKELIGFIVSQGNIGNCDCCKSEDVETIELVELLDFFNELFSDFQVKSEGKSLVSLIQGNWNLFSNLDCGHKILNEALNQTYSTISSSEDLVDFSDEILENINYWSFLKEQLKWEKRYFTNIETLTDDLGWDSFFESKTIINEDETYYRARLHQNSQEEIYPIDNMSCPPARYASAGRANPIGIPYLYLSDNEETILYEIRASYLDEISVAVFTKNKEYQNEIIISDFTEIPTLYHPNGVNKKIKSTLLKQLISRDLSKPMRRYDSELDYIPTQFICEFIKTFTNVQGIKFRSSLHNTGSNLVLFNQKTMKCRSVKKVQISKVSIKARKI
ncbi:RES family NAD+ phosphorylase [Arachidicoccus sp.]|uniref:RES family NAD+ phosphorylase n=1 Tax=Arachidicoccus sp. TaxID=1872624 RepID=UPI003D217708